MPKNPVVGIIRMPDGSRFPMKRPTTREIHTALRPYSVELGFLAISWNQLHHNLSALFAYVLMGQEEKAALRSHVSRAAWFAVENDFTQRKMLRDGIRADQTSLPTQRLLSQKQSEEIKWVLDQIDDGLRHKRNNAIHAPLIVVRGVKDDAAKTWVEAHFDPWNPRAKPLRGKDLIQEFRDYTAHARVLANYAEQMWYALRFPEHRSWPERPPLPQAHKTKRKTHRAPRKPPAHQREA